MMAGQAHERRSVRLKDYDYASPGAYFVTICTRRRALLFGTMIDGAIQLSDEGQIVAEEWQRSELIRAEIGLDEWVVMPNHLHGVVWIGAASESEASRGKGGLITGATEEWADGGAHGRAPLHRKPRSLGSFIAGYKSAVTVRVNGRRGTPGATVWQRGYYEHVIRSEHELETVRRYICDNPLKWALDRENPSNTVEGKRR